MRWAKKAGCRQSPLAALLSQWSSPRMTAVTQERDGRQGWSLLFSTLPYDGILTVGIEGAPG